MESNLICESTLNKEVGCIINSQLLTLDELERSRTINTIAIQLEACIIKYKIDPSTSLSPKILDALPKTAEVISEDVLLCCGKMVPSSRLQRLDLFFGHIYEEGEIGRISPQTHYRKLRLNRIWMKSNIRTLGELEKHELLRFILLSGGCTFGLFERFGKPHRQLKHSI